MAQSLPKSDSFDAGATAYGSTPVFWQRFEPWTAAEAATGYGITCRPGDLHTGYYQPPNELQSIGIAKANAAASYGDPGTLGVADDLFCSWLWRDHVAADGSASVWVNQYKTTGIVGDDSWRYVGVCVRASGQALTSGSSVNERLTDGDSYWFVLANKVSAGGAEWLLLRVNGGTVTELDSLAVDDIAELQLRFGRELRLKVEDNAGDVVLTASTTFNYGQAGTPATSTIFSHTDSSGSKITAAGRFGFGSTQGRVESGGSTVPVFSNFTLRDGADAQVLRDQFRRASLQLLPTALEDPLGRDGRNLLSAWTGDWRSNFFAGELQRDGDRIKIDGGLPVFGYFLSQVKYGPTQDRSAIFEFSSSGVAPFQIGGLLVRFGTTAAASLEFGDQTGLSGYVAYLRYTNSGGTWQALLYAYFGGTETLLATSTISSLSLDTPWTLRFFIENQGGSSAADGIPALDIQLNGTTIPWESAGVPGVLVQGGTNLVFDTRSQAIETGNLQGLVLNASGSDVYVDTWSDSEVSNPPPGDDEPSIPIQSETSVIIGELVLDFEYGYSVEVLADPRVYRYDSGHVYRSLAQSEDRRLWTISATIQEDKIQPVRDFWDSHRGAQVAFNWIEPDDGTAVVVCIDQDELEDRLIAPGVYVLQLRMLELFDREAA